LGDDCLISILGLREKLKKVKLHIAYSFDALAFIVILPKLSLFALFFEIDLIVDLHCLMKHHPEVGLVQIEKEGWASDFCELTKMMLSPRQS
jgi:hypothetical protein